ncbi:hypothetical protein C7212DRAFT_347291 [Tuber magnatum]|uniref:Hypervirulence associated protein TUDOR domain-containing protein n=1 Tax=Tuber magnatum TaxID=42249 RepID=A0A317SJ33_9PEZI|nr:hypothetical protein C7212DRAFT_347291 [Tuber magnatum]
MTDKNPKDGDKAETEDHGSLEITSMGKGVHKNADPKNPAVHVARDGNDVVKRASELTKESTDATNDSATSSAAAATAEPNNANGGGEEKKEVEIGEKRDRAEDEGKPAAQELTEAEKDAGKETKKPKLAEGAVDGAGENGGASNGGGEAASPPKKRGPGRPKKSEKEAKKRDEAAKPETSSAETISGRTRSKAS